MIRIVTVIWSVLWASVAVAQEWPTFRKDNFRSATINSAKSPATFRPAWSWQSELPPDPAWDGPARWDAFSKIRDLPAMRQYDACFHPISDGSAVYFGSSSQDALTALAIEDGKQLWQFIAGGPIRLAPTMAGKRILFGSDDGFVYCLAKDTGKLIWKFSPSVEKAAEQRQVINNDRIISCYPIRTGVTVRDGIVYFGASFLPWRESYICAVDLETGKLNDTRTTFVTQHDDATLEGNLLVAENRLIVPQGRVAPRLFDRSNGESLGSLPGGGGVTIVLTESGDVVRTEGGSPARSGQIGVFKGKERVASFPRGRAIVVSTESFFVIDGQKLFAASRQDNELKWSRVVDEPLELIKVGKTLFVGGRDHVTAINSDDGAVVWSAPTQGRAYGLAFANQRLIVSTDSGSLHVFAQDSVLAKAEKTASNSAPTDKPNKWMSPMVPRVRNKNLLHRWVFHRSAMKNSDKSDVTDVTVNDVFVNDHASGTQLKLVGNGNMVQINESNKLEGIELAGGMFPVDAMAIANLPQNEITVEAWARIDQTQKWGGIAGCIQDDGNTEHGWQLGYQGDQFSFAIAGGGSGLTYMTAADSFKTGTWNHLVGTYNGREMRLYVNGSLAASGVNEAGNISYSDKTFFTVGAYRDSDESFPMTGALQEVRIYSTALDATSISKQFEVAASEFGVQRPVAMAPQTRLLAWGPYTRFVGPGEVEISYRTLKKQPTVVNLITESEVKRHVKNMATLEHKINVAGLPFRRALQFQILDRDSDKAISSQAFALDTHFDWTAHGTTDDSKRFADLIAQSPNPRGMVFVIGADQQTYAQQLARETQFTVVLLEEDPATASAIRTAWAEDPDTIYGRRLNVSTTNIRALPAACAAIIIASNQTDAGRRLIRPGGIAFDGKEVTWKRPEIRGSGVWSHMYGTADNSAFGGEELSGASDRQQLLTQWIGRPGPRYQTDRQNRKPSPLSVGGRLFLQGQQRMIALDSFSGTVLWSVESPTVMRWNIPRDSSNWCADEDHLFVAAENEAWKIRGRDGEIQQRLPLPDVTMQKHDAGMNWGYIARYENSLLGTAVRTDAIYTKWWGSSQWFDSTGGGDTHAVAGEQLFSINPETGDLNWQYRGLILHPTITIMDGCVYFIQDKTPAHLSSDQRRISIDESQDLELVCLGFTDGKVRWRKSLPSFKGHIASLYLAGGGDDELRSLVMVASEATASEFSVAAFAPDSGETNWKQTIPWEANHHGKHISRPAIQGDLIYIRPEVLQLADGKTMHRGFPSGHGCSSYTASANGIFSRLGETTWWDARTQKVNRFKRIRTDCWISVIPAQGMLLSAEGGGGCSCGTWLETSLGFLPRSVDEELPTKELPEK